MSRIPPIPRIIDSRGLVKSQLADADRGTALAPGRPASPNELTVHALLVHLLLGLLGARK